MPRDNPCSEGPPHLATVRSGITPPQEAIICHGRLECLRPQRFQRTQGTAMPEPPGHNQFQIHVDGAHFTVTQSSMTGAAIKGLAAKGPEYQLFLEQGGNDPDRPVRDDETVTIRN